MKPLIHRLMSQTTSKIQWLLCALLIAHFSNQLSAEVFVHSLNFRSAEQIIPLVKPHLKDTTTVTGKGFQLVVNGTPDEHQKIEQLLKALDKKLGQYRVELRVLNRKLADNERKAFSISASKNEAEATVRSYHATGNKNRDRYYSIRLIEGTSGFIQTGKVLTSSQVVRELNAFIPKPVDKKLSSGFYVTVNQIGKNRVQLSVAAQSENRSKKYRSDSDFSKSDTVIAGELGEWLLAASTIEQASQKNSSRGISSTRQSNKNWFYVRAISVDN